MNGGWRGDAQAEPVIGGNLGDDLIQCGIAPGPGLLILEIVSQIG